MQIIKLFTFWGCLFFLISEKCFVYDELLTEQIRDLQFFFFIYLNRKQTS